MQTELMVYNYLNKNSEEDKQTLIKSIIKVFNFTVEKATKLYYKWKRHFMNTEKCVPKERTYKLENGNEVVLKDKTIKGQYGTYKLFDGCICANGHYYNNIDEIERYRYFRYINHLRADDNFFDEAIQVMKIKELIAIL